MFRGIPGTLGGWMSDARPEELWQKLFLQGGIAPGKEMPPTYRGVPGLDAPHTFDPEFDSSMQGWLTRLLSGGYLTAQGYTMLWNLVYGGTSDRPGPRKTRRVGPTKDLPGPRRRRLGPSEPPPDRPHFLLR